MDATIKSRPNVIAWILWAVPTAIALAAVGLPILAPVARLSGHQPFAAVLYHSFGYLCHQIPERSFHLGGEKFAVCSRCMGLYSGFALAALLYPLARSLKRTDTPSVFWLLFSLAPLLVDFLLTYAGIWQNTHLTRFSTGALFGAVTVFYVMPGLMELSQRRARSTV